MTNIYIDPVLLACPEENADEQTMTEYVAALTEWKDLNDSGWITAYIIRDTHKLLAEADKYPAYPHIAKLLAKHNIDYVQASDIDKLVTRFLEKFTTVEDALFLDDYLHDDPKISIDLEDREQIFKEGLLSLCSMIGLNCFIRKLDCGIQLLYIKNYKGESIQFSSALVIAEFNNGTSIDCPIAIDNKYTTCHNFVHLCESIDPVDIWIKSETIDGYLNATKLSIAKLAYQAGLSSLLNRMTISFGTDFIPSLDALHFLKNTPRMTITLKAISQVILGLGLESTHALRNGAGAENPQATSGNYKAWRKDIDYEFHLHYWKYQDRIVLSNVVTHKDFDITGL